MDYVVEAEVECPYCGEVFSITVDTSAGGYSTVEDCTVCCRPISMRVECDAGQVLGVEIGRS
jgi:Cysteine-rich CPXCG